MAERGWVPESASQYLPGLDLEVLLLGTVFAWWSGFLSGSPSEVDTATKPSYVA